MSRYKIDLTKRAKDDAEGQWQHVTAEGVTQDAIDWWYGLIDAIDSLRDNPERCPLAPENDAFSQEIRQLLYGKRKRDRRRILFTIKGKRVRVLHVRHGAQRHLWAL